MVCTLAEGYKKGFNAKALCQGLMHPLSKAGLLVKYLKALLVGEVLDLMTNLAVKV